MAPGESEFDTPELICFEGCHLLLNKDQTSNFRFSGEITFFFKGA